MGRRDYTQRSLTGIKIEFMRHIEQNCLCSLKTQHSPPSIYKKFQSFAASSVFFFFDRWQQWLINSLLGVDNWKKNSPKTLCSMLRTSIRIENSEKTNKCICCDNLLNFLTAATVVNSRKHQTPHSRTSIHAQMNSQYRMRVIIIGECIQLHEQCLLNDCFNSLSIYFLPYALETWSW